MRIEQLTAAEAGWKAVFREPDGKESLSRIVGWAVVGDDVAGVIVDPSEPSRLVAASSATSPAGGSFVRYRFVEPKPIVVAAPPEPPPAATDSPEQLAKSILKRRR